MDQKQTRIKQNEQQDYRQKNKRGDIEKWVQTESSDVPDSAETSEIPGLPSEIPAPNTPGCFSHHAERTPGFVLHTIEMTNSAWRALFRVILPVQSPGKGGWLGVGLAAPPCTKKRAHYRNINNKLKATGLGRGRVLNLTGEL